MADSGGKEMKEMMETGMKIVKDLGLEETVKDFMKVACKSSIVKNGMSSLSPDATPFVGAGKGKGMSM